MKTMIVQNNIKHIYIYIYERMAFAVSSIVFIKATRAPVGLRFPKLCPLGIQSIFGIEPIDSGVSTFWGEAG